MYILCIPCAVKDMSMRYQSSHKEGEACERCEGRAHGEYRYVGPSSEGEEKEK